MWPHGPSRLTKFRKQGSPHTNLLCKIQEKKRNIFFHSLKMDMPEELKYVLFNNNNINGFGAGEFKQFIPVMQVMPSLMDNEIS